MPSFQKIVQNLGIKTEKKTKIKKKTCEFPQDNAGMEETELNSREK